MTVQRRLHLVAVGRIALQHLVVGDQTLRALGQEDLVPEFHRLAFLASLDQVRVVLEDRVHFLPGRNLLSVQHPPPGLVHDLIAQAAVSRDLLAKLVNHHAAEHIDALDLGGLFHHLARALEHLPGRGVRPDDHRLNRSLPVILAKPRIDRCREFLAAVAAVGSHEPPSAVAEAPCQGSGR